MYCATMKYVNF